ncbi:MAG: hypothetical protein ACI92E_000669 [Oceanicoccus sp.]|jgi:hypothetical protein
MTARQLLTFTLLFSSCLLNAEQKQSFGQFDIHYSVVNSTFISAEVARIYNIVRGANRALINIAIRKNLEDGSNKAQKAVVTGHSSDLMRETPLKFLEIVEQNAIYYIAEVKFYNEEIRHFTINVQPDDEKMPLQMKFTKTLYRDN